MGFGPVGMCACMRFIVPAYVGMTDMQLHCYILDGITKP